MALLSVVEFGRAGVVVSDGFAASAGGDEFDNTGVELFAVFNGDVSPKTVTFVTQIKIDGFDVPDRNVVIPAGETWVIGPFPVGIYNSGGRVEVTYSAVTAVEVKVLRSPDLRAV